jgi:hypothetical protein
VAHVLAGLAPDRIREHQRWLTDDGTAESDERPRAVAQEESESALHRAAGMPRPFRERLRSGLARFGAGIAIGAVVTGILFASLRPKDADAPAPPTAYQPETPRTPGVSERPPAPVVPEPTSPRGETVAATSRPSPAPSAPPSPVARVSREPKREHQAAPGALHVSARPTWATIMVDGKSVGATPLVVPNVPAGKHTIEALPGGRGPALVRSVVVPEGGVSRIEFRFDEVAPR